MGALHDLPDTWREKSRDLCGRALPCGHDLREDVPRELLAELETSP